MPKPKIYLDIIKLDNKYSTTRRVIKELTVSEAQIKGRFNNFNLLPDNKERYAQGGLRTKGYYKCNEPDKPLFSIITVVYNGGRYLEETINSVINQTYDNVEFIIIDGGSTDNSLDILYRYDEQIDYWVSEPDEGIYDAWNKAISCHLGEWINFQGADDYLFSEDVLENVANKIIDGKYKVNIIYGDVVIINEQEMICEELISQWDKEKFINEGIYFSHQGVFHNHNLFKTVGKFNPKLSIAGDYELLLRELKNNDPIYMQGIYISAMRQGGVSGSDENSVTAIKQLKESQKENSVNSSPYKYYWILFKAYIKKYGYYFFGDVKTKKLINAYRKLSGRKKKWLV